MQKAKKKEASNERMRICVGFESLPYESLWLCISFCYFTSFILLARERQNLNLNESHFDSPKQL